MLCKSRILKAQVLTVNKLFASHLCVKFWSHCASNFSYGNRNEVSRRLDDQIQQSEKGLKDGMRVMIKIIDEKVVFKMPDKVSVPAEAKSPRRRPVAAIVTDLTGEIWDMQLKDFVLKAMKNARKVGTEGGSGLSEASIGDLTRIAQRILVKMVDGNEETPTKKRKAAVKAEANMKRAKNSEIEEFLEDQNSKFSHLDCLQKMMLTYLSFSFHRWQEQCGDSSRYSRFGR
jgi:hypothetical protein